MKLTLSIESGNAALTGDDMAPEVARLLRHAADQVEDGFTSGYLRDYNGNTVGSWEVSA